jgi:hypothetical protein
LTLDTRELARPKMSYQPRSLQPAIIGAYGTSRDWTGDTAVPL